MNPVCFMYFKTWVSTPKLSFYDKYLKNDIIVKYDNRQPVSMAAILNKKFLRWDFWGLCTRLFSGHPCNFPENFSFLHFFQAEPQFSWAINARTSKYKALARIWINTPHWQVVAGQKYHRSAISGVVANIVSKQGTLSGFLRHSRTKQSTFKITRLIRI